MDQPDLSIYAKEEALKAIMHAYSKANLDVMVTVVFEGCDLGLNATSQGAFAVQRMEGDKVATDMIDYTTLRYRMNYNNKPEFEEKGIRCILSMNSEYVSTYVPYINIVAVLLDADQTFGIHFPYIEIEAQQKQIEKAPVKQKPKLRIV